jgi:hypothetical protein
VDTCTDTGVDMDTVVDTGNCIDTGVSTDAGVDTDRVTSTEVSSDFKVVDDNKSVYSRDISDMKDVQVVLSSKGTPDALHSSKPHSETSIDHIKDSIDDGVHGDSRNNDVNDNSIINEHDRNHDINNFNTIPIQMNNKSPIKKSGVKDPFKGGGHAITASIIEEYYPPPPQPLTPPISPHIKNINSNSSTLNLISNQGTILRGQKKGEVPGLGPVRPASPEYEARYTNIYIINHK